ncbi:hypothetical protein [Halobiforma nitratireducens]|uniref:Uncharacterized protein n=1 Tax=Halobiforma nitratireducens JCM 10879 TaxID=1227454 RepID=M0LWP9_9EURY|nr:hypothetical protein [Halobiforma nitratireducens]EMA36799.1 hypothetical protein C446_11342 [Halobiforma nitratireducens JCM 10879]
MSVRQPLSIAELFRATPATSALLTLGPLALALGQLLNSYVNDVSVFVSLSFAAVMLAFAAVATGHHAAEYRLRELERGVRLDSDSGIEREN